MPTRRFACACLAAVLIGASPAMAQAPAPAAPNAPATPPAPAAGKHHTVNLVLHWKPESAQQQADQAVVQALLAAGGSGGLAAICARSGELRAVLDHAPASFPRTEVHGPIVTVRGETQDQAMMLAVLASLTAAKDYDVVTVRSEFDTYPQAALLLGSCANEQQHWDEAVRWLDRGLAMQPDHAYLTSEKATSLEHQGHMAEGYALVDGYLRANPLTSKAPKALLLRNKGFALVELKRLDEAEQAYRDSLAAEPNHAGALHELAYIARLKAGGPSSPAVQVTGDKAAAGEFPKAPPKP